MNKKSKGFIELSIIILLVLVIVGGLLYFSWQKGMIKTRTNPEVPSTPSIIDNENTNGKPYKNTKYGFSFNYPNEFKLSEEETPKQFILQLTSQNEELSIDIQISEQASFASSLSKSIKTINKNVITWTVYPPSYYCDMGMCGDTSIAYETEKSPYRYSIFLNKIEEDSASLDQILSTFKFIDSYNANTVDFSLCPEGKTYHQVHGLGSNSLTIKRSTKDSCEIEFSREIEGGYSQYYCTVPKKQEPITFPATSSIEQYCKLIKSGIIINKLKEIQ